MNQKTLVIGAIVTALGGVVTIGIQLDKYLLERQRMKMQMAHEAEVMACEEAGGRWFRGSCEKGGSDG